MRKLWLGKLARSNFFLDPFLTVLIDNPALTYVSVRVFGMPANYEFVASSSDATTALPSEVLSWDIPAQDAWLRKHVAAPWTRSDEGTCDVDGDVTLRDLDIRQLPVKFGRIRGTFDCATSGLASVRNLPQQVDGDLICCNNRFASLEGISITKVGGLMCFHGNPLSSHMVGLTNIEGGQRVGLDHPVVRRIFNYHEGKLNDERYTIQAELIENGLEPFADL